MSIQAQHSTRRRGGLCETPTTLGDADEKALEANLLDERELRRALASEPAWELRDGALVRELMTRDFDAAIAVLELVAGCAIDYGRRPDMCISEFNHVRLSISNPHHAGLTAAELRLAAKVSAVLDGEGSRSP
jgi:pterin-4a-carbinolamine dehydratase